MSACREVLTELVSDRQSEPNSDELSEVSTNVSVDISKLALANDTKLPSQRDLSNTLRHVNQKVHRREQEHDDQYIRQASLSMIDQEKQKQASPAWRKLQEKRRCLPAWKARDEIIEKLSKHQVLIISGETGCGKTTQVKSWRRDGDKVEHRGMGKMRIWKRQGLQT
eukprot:748909-Hanusia_phi.AAC.1